MKQRILSLIAAMAFTAGATAQSLTASPIETTPGTDTQMTVSLSGATEKSALQFNLGLPDGLTLTHNDGNHGITLGTATNGHTLSVNPLDNGQYLIVLYSLEQNNFSDGTLLTIPVTAVNTPGSTLGSLNTVRTATTGAQSSTIPDATITATVEQPAFDLTVTSVGYASLYLSSAVEIPLDVEVYTATAVEGDLLKMQQVTGILPANTGAIVKADAGTYSFNYSDENPAAIEGNLLLGTTTSTYIKPTAGTAAYVLSQVDGIVGMYLAELNGEGRFLNNANKAYMLLGEIKIEDGEIDTSAPGTQLSAGYRFDFGGTTGVEKVETRKEKVEIYDLQGRRVEHPRKGLYIVNGRVMLVK